MRWKRRTAIYCGSSCRADASRLLRLLQGGPVDHYASVAAFIATRHRRNAAVAVPSSASDGRRALRRASGRSEERAA